MVSASLHLFWFSYRPRVQYFQLSIQWFIESSLECILLFTSRCRSHLGAKYSIRNHKNGLEWVTNHHCGPWTIGILTNIETKNPVLTYYKTTPILVLMVFLLKKSCTYGMIHIVIANSILCTFL